MIRDAVGDAGSDPGTGCEIDTLVAASTGTVIVVEVPARARHVNSATRSCLQSVSKRAEKAAAEAGRTQARR